MDGTNSPLFVSYARADSQFVVRLRADLQKQGVHIWMDETDIQPGTPDWQEALRAAVRNAQAVLLIASPHIPPSIYVRDELGIADMYKRPICPVWIAGSEWMAVIPIGRGGLQHIDARGTRYSIAVQAIVKWLRNLPPPPDDRKPPLKEHRNPYKGLRAFTSHDAPDFFGRDKLIEELGQTLKTCLATEQRQKRNARLLAVVGPSGSGKSSIVMAGLLPRLQTGMLPGSQNWLYLTPIVPGIHPIESLALTFEEQLPERGIGSLCDELEDDSARGLHLLSAALVRRSGTRVVLVVDQFEELFRLTTEKELRVFINLLVTALTEHAGPLIVILTLRADFDDRTLCYPELGALIEEHRRPVLPMEMEDYRAIIVEPAKLPDVQLSFEGDLVGDLLFEVHGQIGALPLLQFTLDQLFERRDGPRLTLSAYHEMGGVKGALCLHAEQTYAALPSEEHRRLAQALFLRLIEPGTSEQDTTRRRAAFAEFTFDNPTQTSLMYETINAFIEAYLLTASDVAGTRMLEVSHEAVLREWKCVGDWLHEAGGDVFIQQDLSKDTAEWERHNKSRAWLYRGSRLKEVQAWAKRNMPSKQEQAFLRASALQRILSFLTHAIPILLILMLIPIGIVIWQAESKHAQPPDTKIVTKTQDSDQAGTLRWCINNAPSGSTIRFAPNVRGTIKLTEGDLAFAGDKKLTVVGPGAKRLTISGGANYANIDVFKGATVTISGLSFKNSQTIVRAFVFNEGTLTITNSIISNNTTGTGTFAMGGGIYNGSTLTVKNSLLSNNVASGDERGVGGGIDNAGKLTVVNSRFLNNTAHGGSGAGLGGGIYNYQTGTAVIETSTFSENKAISNKGSKGGGIDNYNKLTVVNSTFSKNRTLGSNGSTGTGGGIDNDSGGTTIMRFSTLFENTSQTGGGIWNDPTQSGRVRLSDSIVADDHAQNSPDISGVLISEGYNLIEDETGTHGLSRTDRQVTLASLKLDPVLRSNGGPTQTLALLPGSPALDAVPGNVCKITFTDVTGHTKTIMADQRRDPRFHRSKHACDIGAI